MAPLRETWIRELRKGSIQMCIMAAIGSGKKYGFQIVKDLYKDSNGYYDLKEGTLYPILHRLEKQGYLESEWQTREKGVPRKYYHLTEEGMNALDWAKEQWVLMLTRCNQVLEAGH